MESLRRGSDFREEGNDAWQPGISAEQASDAWRAREDLENELLDRIDRNDVEEDVETGIDVGARGAAEETAVERVAPYSINAMGNDENVEPELEHARRSRHVAFTDTGKSLGKMNQSWTYSAESGGKDGFQRRLQDMAKKRGQKNSPKN